MSWHTNAVLIHDDFSKDIPGLLKKLGLKVLAEGEEISFDKAASSSNEQIAVGVVDGWTSLWGQELITLDRDTLVKLSRKADIFEATLVGISAAAGFTWYSGGKVVRDWLIIDGEIAKDDGKPLKFEKAAFKDAKGDDEQAVLNLLADLTVPFKSLNAMRCQVYEIADE